VDSDFHAPLAALGLSKKAAARVNSDLGLLDRNMAEAIAVSGQEVESGHGTC